MKDQELLLKKITLYLKNKLNPAKLQGDELKHALETIDYFEKSAGDCVGLSTLWLYGMMLSTIENNENKPRDDIEFFRYVDALIRNWDGKDINSFTQEQQADIEGYISNIYFYQGTISSLAPLLDDADVKRGATDKGEDTAGGHLELEITFADTKAHQPIRVFDAKISTNKEILENKLAQIIHPKTLIFVGVTKGSGHMMAIFQKEKDGEIYFYDPIEGESAPCKNVKELVDLLWESSDLAKVTTLDFVERDLKLFSVRVFKFKGDEEYTYPPATDWHTSLDDLITIATNVKDVVKTYPFYDSTIENIMKDVIRGRNQEDPKKLAKTIEFLETSTNNKAELSAKQMLIYYILKQHDSMPSQLIDSIKSNKDIIYNDNQKNLLNQYLGNKIDNREFGFEFKFTPLAQEVEVKTIEEKGEIEIKDGLSLEEVISHLQKAIGSNNKTNKILPSFNNLEELSKDNIKDLLKIVKANFDAGELHTATTIIQKINSNYPDLILGTLEEFKVSYGNDFLENVIYPVPQYMKLYNFTDLITALEQEAFYDGTQTLICNCDMSNYALSSDDKNKLGNIIKKGIEEFGNIRAARSIIRCIDKIFPDSPIASLDEIKQIGGDDLLEYVVEYFPSYIKNYTLSELLTHTTRDIDTTNTVLTNCSADSSDISKLAIKTVVGMSMKYGFTEHAKHVVQLAHERFHIDFNLSDFPENINHDALSKIIGNHMEAH